MADAITKIEKERSVIKFFVDSSDKYYSYDIATGIITGLKGQNIVTAPFRKMRISSQVEYFNFWIRFLKSGNPTDSLPESSSADGIESWKRMTQIYEFLLSYFDLLDDYFDETELPIGYVKWLRENEKKISSTSLQEFEYYQAIKNLSKKDIHFIEGIKNFCSSHSHKILVENKNIRDTISKILVNSFKIFDLSPFNYGSSNKIDLLIDNVEICNTEKTISANIELINAKKDELRMLKIEQNQNKILPLMNYQSDDFIIIVPTKQEQFANEGEQQHNCVGYYYHDSIIRGENLIYFIRKKEEPEKSYITCRYDDWNKSTVEYKLKHNDLVCKQKDKDFIKEVDKEIERILDTD